MGVTLLNPLLPPAERFWAKVDKTGDCWLWTAALSRQYGRFYVAGRLVMAHRFAYELERGEIPAGHELDHRPTCPKRCVNPAHLRPVTHAQNLQNRPGPNANSTSGARGVVWDRKAGKWRARAKLHGKWHYGGTFDQVPDAEAAAIALRNRLFTHNDADRTR